MIAIYTRHGVFCTVVSSVAEAASYLSGTKDGVRAALYKSCQTHKNHMVFKVSDICSDIKDLPATIEPCQHSKDIKRSGAPRRSRVEDPFKDILDVPAFYTISFSDGSFYHGSTSRAQNRLRYHVSPMGKIFTRKDFTIDITYTSSRDDARTLEQQAIDANITHPKCLNKTRVVSTRGAYDSESI